MHWYGVIPSFETESSLVFTGCPLKKCEAVFPDLQIRMNRDPVTAARGSIMGSQEAMENFVFPDEIKTKLMKIDI